MTVLLYCHRFVAVVGIVITGVTAFECAVCIKMIADHTAIIIIRMLNVHIENTLENYCIDFLAVDITQMFIPFTILMHKDMQQQ